MRHVASARQPVPQTKVHAGARRRKRFHTCTHSTHPRTHAGAVERCCKWSKGGKKRAAMAAAEEPFGQSDEDDQQQQEEELEEADDDAQGELPVLDCPNREHDPEQVSTDSEPHLWPGTQ